MVTLRKTVARASSISSTRSWRRFTRFLRRNREVIMLIAVLAMSLAFLAYGISQAVQLEAQHPGWFGRGY
jgi:hypothetical protein